MQRQPVSSSNLSSVGYDEVSHVLEIAFHNGGIYQYFNVPQNVHVGLMNASSHGQYFYYNIRNVYGYRRIL